jgi:hypothetical protein
MFQLRQASGTQRPSYRTATPGQHDWPFCLEGV